MSSKHQNKDGPAYTVLIAPEVLAADNTPAALDVRDHSQVEIALAIGVGGITFSTTNKIEFVLTHCDTSGGTYAAVAAADVVLPGGYTLASGGIVRSLVAAHAAATNQVIHYVGGKGFLKLLADFSGTHGTGTPISAVARLSRGRTIPSV